MVFQKSNPESSVIEGESKTWNIAALYSKLKVMLHLRELDKLEMVAQFGKETMESEEVLNVLQKRIEALLRIISTLRILIDNAYFNLKKNDKEDALKFCKRLDEIENKFDKLQITKTDQRNNTIRSEINEPLFNAMLKELRKIKRDLNEPLNRANFIFGASEEVDLDALQRELIEGG